MPKLRRSLDGASAAATAPWTSRSRSGWSDESLDAGSAGMTYCIGMLLKGGLVMLSDSRTNAGVDNIATFRKMTVWEQPGERVIALMGAGNLAITQAVVTYLE